MPNDNDYILDTDDSWEEADRLWGEGNWEEKDVIFSYTRTAHVLVPVDSEGNSPTLCQEDVEKLEQLTQSYNPQINDGWEDESHFAYVVE